MPKVHLEKEVGALAMGLQVTFKGVASLFDEINPKTPYNILI
jgi:hypothetical protein